MPPITTSSCPCSQKFEKEKTKLLTVHTPMSSKTREIISIPVVLQPALVQPSIATDRCSPSYLIIKKCYFFNVSFIFYHCQFYSTEGAKLSLLYEDEWSFKKKTNSTTPFQSEKESNISLLSHYIPSMSAGDRAMRRYSGKFRVTRIGFQFTSDFSGS